MGRSQSPPGEYDIKRTPLGFIIEKNGASLHLSDSETNILHKALSHAIEDGDFEFLESLLPPSFISEPLHSRSIRQLRNKRIAFISDSPEFASSVRAVFEEDQISHVDYLDCGDERIFAEDRDLLLVFHTSPMREFLLRLNRFWLDKGIVLIKAMFDNAKFAVTPFLFPRESACYDCYVHLKTHNHIFDRDTLEARDFLRVADVRSPRFSMSFCAHFLIGLAGGFSAVERASREEIAETILDLERIEISRNPLLRVPTCPECNPHTENR